jgi:hypothetical protein
MNKEENNNKNDKNKEQKEKQVEVCRFILSCALDHLFEKIQKYWNISAEDREQFDNIGKIYFFEGVRFIETNKGKSINPLELKDLIMSSFDTFYDPNDSMLLPVEASEKSQICKYYYVAGVEYVVADYQVQLREGFKDAQKNKKDKK